MWSVTALINIDQLKTAQVEIDHVTQQPKETCQRTCRGPRTNGWHMFEKLFIFLLGAIQQICGPNLSQFWSPTSLEWKFYIPPSLSTWTKDRQMSPGIFPIAGRPSQRMRLEILLNASFQSNLSRTHFYTCGKM